MADDAIDVVVPTVGRPSLATLLWSLARGAGDARGRIIVVDDRRDGARPLPLGPGAAALGDRLVVERSGGRGPAAARNVGWRRATTEWIACLDDDVIPGGAWWRDLALDLTGLADEVGASQGRIRVPPPFGRRRTDRERGVQGLETASWIAANMAYRRTALAAVGGFDERFPRAYREDADLALRLVASGWRIVRGRRRAVHPAWPSGFWGSVRAQAGNADDALMRALHGLAWRERIHTSRARFAHHAALSVAGIVALAASGGPEIAAAGLWIAGTLRFAWQRIAPGPRSPAEVAAMLATSAAIPPVAVWHRVRGEVRARALRARAAQSARSAGRDLAPPAAVLFDRDGTLVVDVPANADPERVQPMPGARTALDRLRSAGVRVGVVSNQPAVAEGRLSRAQLAHVNRRIDRLLGPFDAWFVCCHPADAGCRCRKPLPGGLESALAMLGVPASRSAYVGDIGADVAAARAAGVRAILVPTPVTRSEEVLSAPEVARDLHDAVDRLLGRP
ncbi:MAG TPA: HAD-IIIA family hydrolase [Candidatus Binatia bacterium]|nr:HAD-IIIA family hydrolase [Candidatus Binatia bacterium]